MDPSVSKAALEPWGLVERLAALPALAHVSTACLAALAEHGGVRSFVAGETILEEGRPVDAVYCVLSGRAKMERSVENGRRALLALFHPGDLFGTTAALGRRAGDASVIALQALSCLHLARQELMALLKRRPELLEELLPLLTRPLAECRHCTVELSSLRVEERLAKLLLKLADSFGRPVPGGTLIPIQLSRQELADMTGTTIETCIRIMSAWGKKTWVVTGKQGFVVVNRNALECL